MRYYSSTAVATALTAGINNSATSIQVNSVSGFPLVYPYTLSIDADNASKELIEVSAAAGTVLTVTRGVDGTSGVTHSLGAVVRHDHSARDFRESREHEAASTVVHGVTGAVLGTTDTQVVTNKDFTSGTNTFPSALATDAEVIAERTIAGTLTNKSFNLGSNTLTGTTAQFNTALSDNDFATLAGAEALSNKTLASTVTGVTQTDGDNSTKLATTAYADFKIPKSLVTTKGDLIAATAASTLTRVGVGSNNALLVADSAQTSGLRWSTALRAEGNGSPEGVVTAPVGSTYARLDGFLTGTLYMKESGSGSTGWSALGVYGGYQHSNTLSAQTLTGSQVANGTTLTINVPNTTAIYKCTATVNILGGAASGVPEAQIAVDGAGQGPIMLINAGQAGSERAAMTVSHRLSLVATGNRTIGVMLRNAAGTAGSVLTAGSFIEVMRVG